MNIKITKKQNVKIDGVKYVAVTARPDCTGCAFEFTPNMSVCKHIPCCPVIREDGREVIFIRAQDQTA